MTEQIDHELVKADLAKLMIWSLWLPVRHLEYLALPICLKFTAWVPQRLKLIRL